jgi:hypothetical protein
VKEKWGYNSLEYRKSQEHLVFDPIEKHKNIIEYNQKVFERNEKCKPIKVSLIKRLLAYKNSDDYRKQIVYLLINSGARYHELFTGVWALDPENTHNVLLSNIAKTRDKTREISKPLLDDNPTTFMDVLNKIKNRNELSSHALVNRFLNKTIKESTYFLRKAYANMAYHILNDPSMAKTTYISRILGHEVHNEHTALNYQNFYIDNDENDRVL